MKRLGGAHESRTCKIKFTARVVPSIGKNYGREVLLLLLRFGLFLCSHVFFCTRQAEYTHLISFRKCHFPEDLCCIEDNLGH